jgi:fumarylacetoacetate (FAA) hydrolase family protein
MSGSKSSDDTPVAAKSADDGRRGVALSDEAAAAMAAVLHLLRLVSAELVLFRGLDVPRLEKAMREKIGEFTSPISNQQAREVGLTFARALVDQVLVQVRAQAELKNSLSRTSASDNSPPTTPQSPLLH